MSEQGTRFVKIPLTEAVIEIRFPGDARIDALRGEFQQALRQAYPALLVPKVNPGDAPALMAYRFTNDSQTRYVDLAPNKLRVGTQEYPGWDAFLAEFQRHWAFIHDRIAPANLMRVGTRYINEFEGDWPQLVRAELPPYLAPLTKDTVFHHARTQYQVDATMLTVTVEHRHEPSKLIVDYDASRQDSDPGDVEDVLNALHQQTESYFKALISDDLARNLALST